jgi:hypothetical protein
MGSSFYLVIRIMTIETVCPERYQKSCRDKHFRTPWLSWPCTQGSWLYLTIWITHKSLFFPRSIGSSLTLYSRPPVALNRGFLKVRSTGKLGSQLGKIRCRSARDARLSRYVTRYTSEDFADQLLKMQYAWFFWYEIFVCLVGHTSRST